MHRPDDDGKEQPESCLLFAYGLLQPGKYAPETMSSATPDRVLGELYSLGEWPGLVNPGRGDWIPGQVLQISAAELPALDAFEEVHLGEYRRIQIETEQGLTVWLYEYIAPLPRQATRIEKWS